MFKKIKFSTGIKALLAISFILQLLTLGILRFQSSFTTTEFTKINDRISGVISVNYALEEVLRLRRMIVVAQTNLMNNQNPDDKRLLELKTSADKYIQTYLATPSSTERGANVKQNIGDIYQQQVTPNIQQAISFISSANLEGLVALIDSPTYVNTMNLFTTEVMAYSDAINSAIALTMAEEKQQSFLMDAISIAILCTILLLSFLSWRWVNCHIFSPLGQLQKTLSAIAKGDLTHTMTITSQNEVTEISVVVANMQQQLQRIVGVIRETTEAITGHSQHLVSSSHDLSSRTEQQAAALEETAASMEEIASTVRLSAENSSQVNQLATNANSQANTAGDQIHNVINAIADISANSDKINSITSTIESIAFQTNILALNAAVEAARAGEQGKGFAVVAQEVRTLAQRSATATKDIQLLIESTVNSINACARIAENAGATMQNVVTSSTQTTDLIGDIACSCDEQNKGIGQISVAVNQMERVTHNNVQLVQQLNDATHQLGLLSQSLDESVGYFKIHNQKQNVVKNEEPRNRNDHRSLSADSALSPRKIAEESWAEF